MTTFPRSVAPARRVIARTFDATAEVLRKTAANDNAGGVTSTYPVVHTYRCSFTAYPIRPIERENTARVQAIVYWAFSFPWDADITLTDRLRVGTRTFEVVNCGADSQAIVLKVTGLEIL